MNSLTFKYIISTALAIAAGIPAAAADVETLYRLDLSRGKWPADVEVANLNGELPETNVYKRVYTVDGWCIDRYGDRGYVALRPTFFGQTGVGFAAARPPPPRPAPPPLRPPCRPVRPARGNGSAGRRSPHIADSRKATG